MRLLFLVLLAACARPAPVESAPAEAAAVQAAQPTPEERAAFNQRAVELALPIFQRADGTVVTYRADLPWSGDVEAALERMAAWEPAVDLPEAEATRRSLVREELAQGRLTLVGTDDVEADERAMIGHLLDAAGHVEHLYRLQRGVLHLRDRIPAGDPSSRMLFWRNQGPWCETAAMRDEPACAAIPAPPPRRSGLYPAELQQSDDFCAELAESHLEPFVAVVRDGDALKAVPYTERWPEPIAAAAADLRAAADDAPDDEQALRTYLLAAADAFESNDWFAADQAWAAMDQRNSRWFLRVGPDEVYFDPCGAHAGFHLTLARIDPAGLAWQETLEPVKQDMEQAVAELAGPPYTARTVGFDLPEFIRIALNAGDSRSPLGATVGQSLPNWGPVAEAGGRTVAMTNIGTDPDSLASRRQVMASLFCEPTMAAWPGTPKAGRFSTVLHEAAHNLGPSHEYRVEGETDVQRFGGPLASMLEELKAQTAALYLTDWLAAHEVIPAEDVLPTHLYDVGWALGHIARGMYGAAGDPLPYSQLAAIQVGALREHGALAWHPDRLAANGTDRGCLEVKGDALPAAIDHLARQVFRIKATGDREAAEALKARWVDDPDPLHAVVEERFAREPRSSFVYRIELAP